MNFWKFLLYSAAIIITLGIISDDKEANQVVVDIVRDFEPRIVNALKTIDSMFAKKSYFDSDKINLIVSKRIRELDQQLTKIMSAFHEQKPKKRNLSEDINKLKQELSRLEDEVKQNTKSTAKNKQPKK